ncbi:MAG: glycosyltransferase family 9 protein [Prevotellaceae bacterium]|nr:glycosyltransferase family 9 protein [Candidatus Colivivens equi]
MRVLVIRFSALGDVAMTVPVIKSFASQHPDIEIKVLTRTRFTPLFSWMPSNVELIGINLENYKGIWGLRNLYLELKSYDFDCIVDLHDVLRSKIIRWFFKLSGHRVFVINKGRKEKREIIGNGITSAPLKPMKERYAEVLRMIADFELDKNVGNNVRRGVDSTHCVKIGVAPFAAYTTKMYPLDKMKNVVDALSERGVEVYLFGGGENERKILQTWENRNIRSMCGKLGGLKEELECIKQLDLMITMDSGNLHLAHLMGTPTLSIWGATHPKAGFAPDDTVIIDRECQCRPCSIYGNKPCKYGDMRCLSQISPEEIVKEALGRN